jgi:hypothetical protein
LKNHQYKKCGGKIKVIDLELGINMTKREPNQNANELERGPGEG